MSVLCFRYHPSALLRVKNPAPDPCLVGNSSLIPVTTLLLAPPRPALGTTHSLMGQSLRQVWRLSKSGEITVRVYMLCASDFMLIIYLVLTVLFKNHKKGCLKVITFLFIKLS